MSAERAFAPAPPLEDPAEFIKLGKYDWLVSKSWNRLHAVLDGTWTSEHRADMAGLWAVSHPVRLACGRTAAALFIPGISSRLSLPRCTGCCRTLGGPPGTGSPKNCDAWRAILGLG